MWHGILFGFLIFSASIWIGGMLTVILAATSTSKRLDAAARVAFFRDFGRKYVIFAGVALVVAIVSGGLLLAAESWTGLSTALTLCTLALVIALSVGVVQARRMTHLRRETIEHPDDGTLATRLKTTARLALGLRGGLTALTLAVYVLAVVRWA